MSLRYARIIYHLPAFYIGYSLDHFCVHDYGRFRHEVWDELGNLHAFTTMAFS